MEFIKGISQIKEVDKNFKCSDLTQIISFTYSVDLEDKYNTANLMVSFAIKTKNEVQKQKITLKFVNVSDFKLAGVGQMISLSSFEIEDMKNKGWDLNQRFIVKDYEDEKLELKCSSIEVVSVGNLYE